MSKQNGFSLPVVIILVGLVIAVVAVGFGIYLTRNVPEKERSLNQEPEGCVSTSYGGCDKDPNFYRWEDDGLP